MILLNPVGRIFVGSFRQRCSILLVPIVLLLGARLFAQTPTDPQQLNVPEEDSSFRHFRIGLSGGLNIAHHATGTFTSSCTDFTDADATHLALVGSYETLVVPNLSLWF
jgi:hypothetical protein